VQAADDPAAVAAQLSAAADTFEATEAPAEIAEDWAVLSDALRTWADTASTVDLATPEGQAQFTQTAQEFQAAFTGPSGQAVDAFGTANCT
jgi:hypothetical protein